MAEQPTPSYADITLIDCNRLNSEEVKAGNTSSKAQFTCKTGTGLKLNSGDKVSVHSGFVSDRGCGGSVIEFNGRDLNELVNLSYVKKNEGQQLTYGNNDYPFGNYPPDNARLTYYSGETTDTAPLKDNSVTAGISFYKTSNGEGYFHLPRRYDAIKAPFWYSGMNTGALTDSLGLKNAVLQKWVKLLEGKQYTTSKQWQSSLTGSGKAWDIANIPAQWCDNYANGMSVPKNMLFPASPKTIDQQISFWRGRICFADTYRYSTGTYGPDTPANQKVGTGWTKQFWDWDALVDGLPAYKDVDPAVEYKKCEFINNLWKSKNDAARYTIFKKETNYKVFANQQGTPESGILYPDVTLLKTKDDDGVEEDVPNRTVSRADYNRARHSNGGYLQHDRDPSLSEYLLFKEPQTLTVPSGYNAPSNVADDLTNQLNATSQVDEVVGAVGGSLPKYSSNRVQYPTYPKNGDQLETDRQIEGAYMNSETYKPMNCATSVSFQYENYRNFIVDDKILSDDVNQDDPDGNVPADIYFMKPLTDYLSSFETIGVKRPELWIKGREFAKGVGGIWETESIDADDVRTLMPKNIVGEQEGSATGLDTDFPWRNIIYPCISEDLDILNQSTDDIKTNIPWTEGNLNLLKDWFDAQGKYPELFENVETYSNNIHGADQNKFRGISPDYNRFIHINPYHSSYGYKYNTGTKAYETDTTLGQYTYRNVLGSDNLDIDWTTMNDALNTQLDPTMYRGINSPLPSDWGGTDATDVGDNDYGTDFSSFPLWFYYDKSRAEVASGGSDDNNLYYGFAKKHICEMETDIQNPNGTNDKYYAISFTLKKIGGIPSGLYRNKDAADAYIEAGRNLGYDTHFNAYGTSAICMYAGILDQEPKPSDDTGGAGRSYQVHAYNDSGEKKEWWVFDEWNKYYVGANNPQINFDDKSSRFSFNSFHTPEQIGNQPESGSSNTYPVIDDASDQVYKVNKSLIGNVFCPDCIPYQFGAGKVVGVTPTDGKIAESIHNMNIMPFTIMDSHGGIFIEDFGVPQDKWEESMWGIMGFTYEQFHSSLTLSRQTRINNVVTTDDIGKITTNANIVPSTLNEWVTNSLGIPLYTQQLPRMFDSNLSVNLAAESTRADYQPIVIDQTSASINAEKLPRKMLRPYFLIKSNIVGDVNYLGGKDGGQGLPIVYVVNKENAFGDYFFQGSSQTEFTITHPRTLTEITTSIHNPDMSLADLSNDSAIIYKVTKMNGAQLNVAQQILSKKKK